jgi:hypothetical protein
VTAVTLTRAEASNIDRANAVVHRAVSIPWPGDHEAFTAIGLALGGVLDALEIHEAIRKNTLHWEVYDSDLRCYAEPYEVAVTKSAEDAEDAARYLAEVIGAHIGEEAAAYVGGGTGGTR